VGYQCVKYSIILSIFIYSVARNGNIYDHIAGAIARPHYYTWDGRNGIARGTNILQYMGSSCGSHCEAPLLYMEWPQWYCKRDQYIAIYGIILREPLRDPIIIHGMAVMVLQEGPIYCNIYDHIAGAIARPHYYTWDGRNGIARGTNILQYMGSSCGSHCEAPLLYMGWPQWYCKRDRRRLKYIAIYGIILREPLRGPIIIHGMAAT